MVCHLSIRRLKPTATISAVPPALLNMSPKGAVFINTGQRPVQERSNQKQALKGRRPEGLHCVEKESFHRIAHDLLNRFLLHIELTIPALAGYKMELIKLLST